MKTNNYKIINYHGIDWLKNATRDDTGAPNMVVASSPSEHIIITSFQPRYHGYIYSDINPLKLLDLINYDFNLMELIHTNKHKVYFDVDALTTDIQCKSTYRDLIINSLTAIFPNADIAVSGSENDYKYSYHHLK